MGRAPCCDKEGLKKGPWTPEEDQKLIDYINRHGHGSWRALPKHAGLLRCGKSCRLRWTNYLRPDIKRGKFSLEEEQTIIQLHGVMGNKWSAIASHLPGRTDNEIKNYWNTHLKKRLLQMGIDPVTHRPRMDLFDFTNMNQFLGPAPLSQMMNTRLQEAVTREYYLRIAAAIIQQQQADQYNQSVSVVNAAEHVMRSNLENSLSRPDFTPNAMLSQFLAQNPENQLGSLDYNTPLPQVLDQLLSQPQIMKNRQHSSPTSTLHDLNTKLEQQDNSNLSHSSAMMNDEASLILHQKFNSNDGYNNLLNASSLSLQQQTPKSHGINSSLSLDSSAPWPEQNPFGIPKSDSDSVPTLISSTSSPNIFSDSDLVPDASSSMLNLNMSGTGSTTAVARNGSYAFPPELLWDFPENPKQNGKIPDMQNCEDTRDYWSNMLKYVAENSINNNSGLQSIGAQ